MDYYEELGIRPTATAEEIHRAHRRLSKLLHPDQQTDEAVKVLAETQMRRLNAIVEILSDPERRREYDEQISGYVPPPSPVVAQPRWVKVPRVQRFTWRSVPWWVGSTVGAIVLTVGVAWYWADNLGSSFGNNPQVYVRPTSQDTAAQTPAPVASSPAAAASQAPAATPEEVTPKPPAGGFRRLSSRIRDAILPAKLRRPAPAPSANTAQSTSTTIPKYQPPPPLEAREPMTGTPVPAPSEVAPRRFNEQSTALANAQLVRPVVRTVDVPPPPKLALNNPSRTESAPVPLPALPNAAPPPKPSEPPPVAKTAAPAPAAKVTYQHPFEGEWVYAPKEPEKRKPGFYPPEFIDLKLVWNEGGLHGQYRARYQVTDRPISPDVSFVLSPSDSESRKFVWQSSNGSRGTFRINPIDPGTIRIEWRTTVFSPQVALTAGTATLVRRSP